MKIGIVYHNDLDGKCSAAIIYYYYRNEKNLDINFFSYNYSKDVSKYLYGFDKLFIVDCALDDGIMTNLFENYYKSNLIWIDHHISNIMNVNSSIYGLRNPNKAACVLTWNYLFNDKILPNSIDYIGDRDIWEWKHGNLTKGFTEWLEIQKNNPSNSDLWFKIIESNDIGKYIDDGMISYNARIKLIENDVDKLSYESEIDGIKCLKMNYSSIYSVSDACHCMLKRGYDIAWIWHKMRDGKIYNSLRSSGKYDVSKIARNHGGGGHKKAAGFINKKI
jgi:oligoribonuclease NrnB/cAMP/cGMP phosphodiesterase (DHH superfamily)